MGLMNMRLLRQLFPFLVLVHPLLINAQCNLSHSYSPDIVVADGWNYTLVATGLTRPRGMAIDADGRLLVVDVGVGVKRFEVDERSDGIVCLNGDGETIIENEDFNHGIALSEDGETLYVSTSDTVYSFSYPPSSSSANGKELITNMANRGHSTRTLAIHRDTHLLVSVGSQGNIDPEALDASSGRSTIKAFALSSLEGINEPLDYPSNGILLGWGLRNSVGVAIDPRTGGIWSVENSLDMFEREGEEVWEDNPGEELNFHGFANETLQDGFEGPNYGYPQCVAVWDVDSLPENDGLSVGDQIPVEQGDIDVLSDEQCVDPKRFVGPRLTFQAHQAPLDVAFDLYGDDNNEGTGGLWVSFHGSWNRDEPAGYKLSLIPWNGESGEPTASREDRDNYEDVLRNEDTGNCDSGGCFRPVGVRVDKRGRVWMGSDSTGELFLLRRGGRTGGGESGGGSEEEGGEEQEDGAGGDRDGEGGANGIKWNEWIGLGLAGALAMMLM